MEKTFIVDQSDLIKSLTIVMQAVNISNVLPITRCLLITVDGISSTLTATGTDLETTIESSCLVNANEAIEFAIPAKLFFDIVKSLKGRLTIVVNESGIVINTDTGQYKIAIDDAADFPQTPQEDMEPNTIEVSAHELLHIGTLCLNTIANDDLLRPAMTGIYLEKEGDELIVTSTDAHRLTSGRIAIESDGNEVKAIVPKKAFIALKTAITAATINVELYTTSHNVVFKFGDTKIVARLIDATFPNYRVILPTQNNITLKCNTKELVIAVRNAMICTNKVTSLVAISLNTDGCTVKGQDVEMGNLSVQNVAAECSEELNIGFNGKLLIEMLNGISTINCEMHFKTASTAALICEDDESTTTITRLIMPIILS